MLRDISAAPKGKKPFSFSRLQLAWWTVIILSAFISILIAKGVSPTFHESTLILLGISSATTATARIIDRSDQTTKVNRSQDQDSENFFLDILSDENGVSIHRFQTVAFNLAFGIWFICTVFYFLENPPLSINDIIPDIGTNNLILIGLSSGTYAALKTNENKSKAAG